MLSLQGIEDHVQVQGLSWISVPGTREQLESPTGSASRLLGEREREGNGGNGIIMRSTIFILRSFFYSNFTMLSLPPLFVVFLHCFLKIYVNSRFSSPFPAH